MNEEDFIARQFFDYYSHHVVEEPTAVNQREFGFGTWQRKIADRNFSFQNGAQFNSFLRQELPFYASYSVAYYRFPGAQPTSAKQWLGGDLVYEFDADDLKLNCALDHTTWHCTNCTAHVTGSPKLCGECGEKVSLKEWVCPECLGEVKQQTLRLVEWLRNDLGIASGLNACFSGHKGYHVFIRSDAVYALSPSARLELLDYLTAHNLDFSLIGYGLENARGKPFSCPVPKQSMGWGSKTVFALKDFLASCDAELLSVAGSISFREAEKLLLNRNELLAGLDRGSLIALSGKKGSTFWNALLSHVLGKRLLLKLDRQTSVDISKIVRVPNTLHGGTSLLSKKIPLESLGSFDPLADCIVFDKKRPLMVFVQNAPKFYFDGQWMGPFGQERVELPSATALYLLCKGAAILP